MVQVPADNIWPPEEEEEWPLPSKSDRQTALGAEDLQLPVPLPHRKDLQEPNKSKGVI